MREMIAQSMHWGPAYKEMTGWKRKNLGQLEEKLGSEFFQMRIQMLCNYHLQENTYYDCPSEAIHLAHVSALIDILRIELESPITTPDQFRRRRKGEKTMDPATIEALVEQQEYGEGRPPHIDEKLLHIRNSDWTE